MRILFLLCSVSWFGLAIGLQKIISMQGDMIGGSQYFSHVGMGSGYAAQSGLMVAAIALGIGFGFIALKKIKDYSILRVFSLLMLGGVALTYLGLIPMPLPLAVLLSFIHPTIMVFPWNFVWIPIGALLLSAISAGILPPQKSS
ncbi:MAG TPA: hypothetical protein VJ576_10090 [Rhodocyclaceae bacterium]|nr:hypothetical protein [Rhodocyclaceae bacterium]